MQLVDLPTERAVLAGVATYGSAGYDEIADIVSSSSFTHEIHQAFFNCCEYLLKESRRDTQIDLASIYSAANTLGYNQLFEKTVGRELIRGIMNFHVLQSNLRKLAAKVKKLEIGRLLGLELDSAKLNIQKITGDEGLNFILSLAEQPILELTSALSQGKSSGPELMGVGVEDYVEYLINNPVTMIGISTGYPWYDMSIGGGLRRGTVNLVGARPKIGKTTHGDNVALHIAGKTQLPVLNIDTEMTKEKHRHRILANLSKVNVQDVETGKFGSSDLNKDKVRRAAKYLSNIPYFYESVVGMEFEEILSIMRRWIRREVGADKNGNTNPCVIIYDYFRLMNGEGLSNRNVQEYQLLGFQISSLHNFMVRHSVPCLAYLQLNRDGISKEETDIVSGSDRQVWTCSNLSIFKKKSDEELAEDSTSNRKLVVLVTRDGPGLDDGDYINMQFTGQFNQLTEGNTRNQVKNDKQKNSQGFIVNDTDIPDKA